jgi:histidinol phosphatase-like enzyme
MTMPKKQLEKFIAGTYTGEKEQQAYERKLQSILIEFGEQTDEALHCLAKSAKSPQVDMMKVRWKQIQTMLDGCASYQKDP